ncbi:MAG: transcription termination/antitermination protein NusG [Rickettsiaceae bacterium]
MAKWYILHTAASVEKKVKQLILDQAERNNMGHYFEEIFVPIMEVNSVKRGKPTKIEKKFMPGYVFIKMHLDDDSWHLIKTIPKVSGFLGSRKPKPLTDAEVNEAFARFESESNDAESSNLYSIAEEVVISDGPFVGFSGLIEEVDEENSRAKVSVLIFGKSTFMDLNFNQIKKV